MNAALYLRYSSESEAKQFFQGDIDKLESFAITAGYKFDKVHLEVCSGADGIVERPILRNLLKNTKHKRCDAIITTDYSRLSTKATELFKIIESLHNKGIQLITIYSLKEK